MLPSPSLGPPLLSASWSPPLPCGMGLAAGAGAVLAGGAGGVVTTGCAGREWWWWWCVTAAGGAAGAVTAGLGGTAAWCAAAALPQPAARAASSANPAADRVRVNDMTCPSGLCWWEWRSPRLHIWHAPLVGRGSALPLHVCCGFSVDLLKDR